jgi:hypothetical protein
MPRHTKPYPGQAHTSADAAEGILLFSSVQSLYVAELQLSLRTRLAIETHARRMPIVVEPSIARLAYDSADIQISAYLEFRLPQYHFPKLIGCSNKATI